MAEQCHAAGVILVFACSWIKVARIDKFRGHFFAFASSWTKVAQGDKLKDRRQCISLFYILCALPFSFYLFGKVFLFLKIIRMRRAGKMNSVRHRYWYN